MFSIAAALGKVRGGEEIGRTEMNWHYSHSAGRRTEDGDALAI